MDAWSTCVVFKWGSVSQIWPSPPSLRCFITHESFCVEPQTLCTLILDWRAELRLPSGVFSPSWRLVGSSSPLLSVAFLKAVELLLLALPRLVVAPSLPSLLLLLFWFPLWNVTFGDLDRPSKGFCTLGGISIGPRGLFIRDTPFH